MSDAVLVVDDALFDQHAPGGNHPERPARLAAARAGLRASGVRTETLPPADVDRELLLAVHTQHHVDSLERVRGTRAMLDADTYVVPASVDAAMRAAGGCAELGRALASRTSVRGVALVRPPGHHAEPNRAMGFCLVNNIAIAATAAHRAGAKRVAIIDIDVHHGNGTQAVFYGDSSTLFVSTHQWPFYPGTGSVEERGVGDGLGATVNVPLSDGAGDAEYQEAMSRIVEPTVRAFAPDVVLVSAGFDAFAGDPLAGMRVTPRGFARTIAGIVDVAGGAPIGLILEGGYDLEGLQLCVEASVRALVDGFAKQAIADARVGSTYRADINRAAASAARAWPVDA